MHVIRPLLLTRPALSGGRASRGLGRSSGSGSRHVRDRRGLVSRYRVSVEAMHDPRREGRTRTDVRPTAEADARGLARNPGRTGQQRGGVVPTGRVPALRVRGAYSGGAVRPYLPGGPRADASHRAIRLGPSFGRPVLLRVVRAGLPQVTAGPARDRVAFHHAVQGARPPAVGIGAPALPAADVLPGAAGPVQVGPGSVAKSFDRRTRGRRYVETAPLARSGQGGHNTTFAVTRP